MNADIKTVSGWAGFRLRTKHTKITIMCAYITNGDSFWDICVKANGIQGENCPYFHACGDNKGSSHILSRWLDILPQFFTPVCFSASFVIV